MLGVVLWNGDVDTFSHVGDDVWPGVCHGGREGGGTYSGNQRWDGGIQKEEQRRKHRKEG